MIHIYTEEEDITPSNEQPSAMKYSDAGNHLEDQIFRHRLYAEKHTISKIMRKTYEKDLEAAEVTVKEMSNELSRKLAVHRLERLIRHYEEDLDTINSNWSAIKNKVKDFFKSDDEAKDLINEQHYVTSIITTKILPELKRLKSEAIAKHI